MNKNYFNFMFALILLPFCVTNASENHQSLAIKNMCPYVLQMSKLSAESSSAQHTFVALDDFFKKHGIKDDAAAAKFGRETNIFDQPEQFNEKMSAFFNVSSADVVPKKSKKYQAIVFITSGIDVFTERLAFLNRLVKSHNVQTDEVVALVGNHAHRDDLKDVNYLLNLPSLFGTDFDLASFDKEKIKKDIHTSTQKNWIHRDGMEVAWKLVSCDAVMAQLRDKFRYFSGDGAPSLRTEQLLEQLIANGLRKPITAENPIAFIANAQGAAKTKEMIDKYFSGAGDLVDVLVARPIASEVESKLFNDTPQQRAMARLFHFYRTLEVSQSGVVDGKRVDKK